MAEFFIRRPIVAMVISILTCIVGAISLSRLPISEYPNVSPTMIQATTTYRGAAAEAVMQSVATPIETKVNGVDKLLYMQSFNANDGKMTLNVYFDVGTDVDIMQVNTQNRVTQAEAQLPEAVKREGVVVNRSSPDILMVIGLASPKKTYDAVFLSNYLDLNLVDSIKRVKGVGDVKNFTAQDYTMRIWCRGRSKTGQRRSKTGQGDGAKPDFFEVAANRLALNGLLVTLAHRSQDTALPEGNRSGGRGQRAMPGPRHEAIHPVAHWPNAANYGVWGRAPRARDCHGNFDC